MPSTPLRIARGLTLYGKQIEDEVIGRSAFLKSVHVEGSIYRRWMKDLSDGDENEPGLRFFSTPPGKLMFGPGAGLVLGISLGTTSLRAGLFDANGLMHREYQAPSKVNQLALAPRQLLDRIRSAATRVLAPALETEALLVRGKLRFRGVAIAWPAPINRSKRPVGHALSSRSWQTGTVMTERVARHLEIPTDLSHAINDTWSAAVAVAFDRTQEARHVKAEDPELSVVLRLAGGIGGATIVVEPPSGSGKDKHGVESGFAKSILLGGKDAHAGEIGHVVVPSSTIAERSDERPDGLRELKPYRCSCTSKDDEPPNHLEAFVSRAALAQRVAPDQPEEQVIQRILADPHDRVHRWALEDIGILTADCILGSVSMLNPAHITLTGALANPIVRDAFDARLYDEHQVISPPAVDYLDGHHNEFIRARGAALVVLRAQVHRRLEDLVGVEGKKIPRQLAEGCLDIDQIPWAASAGKSSS